VLQPLDITYFKSFKNVLKKKRNSIMERKNYLELDKVTLVKWVDKVLFQSLKKKPNKIRVQGLWDLATKSTTMVGKFGPNKVFITIEEEGEKNAY
jgi:hypothetical protein